MRRYLPLVAALLSSSAAMAQVPKEQLAQPPANARHFEIRSTGGKHGDSWIWTAPDGTLMARESMNLRGQVFELDSAGKADAKGMPLALTVRGVTPTGDAGESFTRTGASASWKSQVDAGSSDKAEGAFYNPLNGPMGLNAWFLETLLATPGQTMRMLPGGEARASRMTSLEVGSGATRQTVTLWQITGVGNTPIPVWADAANRFFAVAGGFDWVPEAYVGEIERLDKAQAAAMAALAPALAKSLVTTPAGAVAFTHVKLFDADALKFLPDQTVVVAKGRIVAVGDAAKVALPAGAQVIDGKGKTLVPGLWDCHMHVGSDFTGPQELSLGVTSVRDPGNTDEQTLDRRARVAKGELLMPHVYASSLIDGKGTYTAQMANVATSEAEAVALVRKAKENGFVGVKFYGTLDYHWLPAAIAEAHKLGLHVHGHIPHGIRPSEAVKDGYDEITHINWIAMEAVPASVLPEDNGILRFEAPGRYAKDFNLDGPELTGLIATMAAKKIYSDPTMVAFQDVYVPENGDLSPSYAAFVGTMPPAVERGFRSGGYQVPAGLTRADYRASWAKIVGILAKMHKAGVPVVAGTDGSGIELIRELEIYQSAGFTAADALAAATIVPARLVGKDGETGSIKVGKAADLVLVEGDPEARISDLRQTRVVMMDGKLMDADALRAAVGFSGRPK